MAKSPFNNPKSRSGMDAQDKTEMIRMVARQLYEKKGCSPGHDLDNWLEAEKLVKSGKVKTQAGI
jgi:hypothetical protein